MLAHSPLVLSIISSKIKFYNLGAPLQRLAEAHPGELLHEAPVWMGFRSRLP